MPGQNDIDRKPQCWLGGSLVFIGHSVLAHLVFTVSSAKIDLCRCQTHTFLGTVHHPSLLLSKPLTCWLAGLIVFCSLNKIATRLFSFADQQNYSTIISGQFACRNMSNVNVFRVGLHTLDSHQCGHSVQ